MGFRDKVLKKILDEPDKIVAFSLDFSPLSPLVSLKFVSSRGVLIGYDEHDREVYFNPLEPRNPHFIIVGGSGTGKSLFCKQLAYYLSDEYQVVFLDPHGDYNKLVQAIGGIVFDCRKNVFEPLAFVRESPEKLDEFVDVLKIVFGLEDEAYLVKEKLKKRMSLSQCLSELPPILRSKLESAFNFFDNKEKIDLGELIDEGAHFSLSFRMERSPLGEKLARFVSALFILNLTHFVWGEEKHKPERFVFMDEAHRIVLKLGGDLLKSMFFELRKTGTGLIAISQNLQHFDLELLDQVGGLLVLSPVSEYTLVKLDALFELSAENRLFIKRRSPRDKWFPERALYIIVGSTPVKVFLKIDEKILRY